MVDLPVKGRFTCNKKHLGDTNPSTTLYIKSLHLFKYLFHSFLVLANVTPEQQLSVNSQLSMPAEMLTTEQNEEGILKETEATGKTLIIFR